MSQFFHSCPFHTKSWLWTFEPVGKQPTGQPGIPGNLYRFQKLLCLAHLTPYPTSQWLWIQASCQEDCFIVFGFLPKPQPRKWCQGRGWHNYRDHLMFLSFQGLKSYSAFCLVSKSNGSHVLSSFIDASGRRPTVTEFPYCSWKQNLFAQFLFNPQQQINLFT